MAVIEAQHSATLTSEGIPLKRKLAKALFRQKMRALMLIAPLLIFVLVTFIAPIGSMLSRSVDNSIVVEILPRTVEALQDWDSAAEELPGEAVFAAIAVDLKEAAEAKLHTRVGSRLNYEQPGIASLFRKSARKVRKLESGPYKEALIEINEDWADPEVWATLKTFSGSYTDGYFLASADLKRDAEGDIAQKPSDERIYITLFWRTMVMSLTITLMTLLLGYPIAYLLATLPMRTSNLLLILVLLPFWTSLLVRTSAWIVLLQQQGVVNDFLVFSGLNSALYNMISIFTVPNVSSLCSTDISQILNAGPRFLDVMAARGPDAALSTCARDILGVYQSGGAEAAMARTGELQAAGETWGYGDERFAMIFNQTGTIVAMTHILLPFMIMPLYSVMQTVPQSFVRAAKSLGASNWTAFWRVYFPNTVPGIGAGAILVFILSIGYYITPALVGGTSGVFISNRIAFHISSSLNWGLAAALGVLLLVVVLLLYWAYDKIVGIDNVKLG